MFRSKMIRDPSWNHSNNGGLTVGITFHSTKRWKCSERNFYSNQFYEMSYPKPASQELLEMSVWQKLAHDQCSKNKKHMSYPGYMYWTGPKNRYEFRFAGATHPREKWWKPFSKKPHGRYVRWRDDGPQNPPRPSVDEIKRALDSPARTAHRENFRNALASYQVQCEEYERVRSANGRGKWKP